MNTIKELEDMRKKLASGYGFSGSSEFIFGIQEENLKLKLKLKEIEEKVKNALKEVKCGLNYSKTDWGDDPTLFYAGTLENIEKILEDK